MPTQQDNTLHAEPKSGGGSPKGLQGWLTALSEKGMPVFASTAKKISGMATDEGSSAAELSRVILQDAAMTARLLKVANSPYFNLSARKICTVSRAVVLIGFDAVRSLCLSIAVLDATSQGGCRERVTELMARSFHAAIQARSFAEKRSDESPEEIFIAALLLNLGEMAFWTHGSGDARRLDAALLENKEDGPRLEREILGFELSKLTMELSKEWSLGKLLDDTLRGHGGNDPRINSVVLGQRLARCAEKGWDTPEVRNILEHIAESLYMPIEEVEQLAHGNASDAAKAAGYFGAKQAGELIPVPSDYHTGEPSTGEDEQDKDISDQKNFLEPDPMLQLTILRELAAMTENCEDISLLMEMILEGVYRGIGMDRTLFAMLNADRTILKARYALGWDKEDMEQRFCFEVSRLKANIFSHVLEEGEPLWMGPSADSRLANLVTSEVRMLTRGAQFFVMPIEVDEKPIGLFYADRAPSKRGLDEEAFTSFKHFCQQAVLAITYLRHRKK